MLNEDEITNILAKYLERKGFIIVQKLNCKQKGIDLVVENSKGIKTFIEIKGETSSRTDSSRYGQPFGRSQIWSHISDCFMKTLKNMSESNNPKNLFGMAFPFNHESILMKIKPYTDKLGITVFLVSSESIKIC